MNYLALCQKVHELIGGGPGEPGTSPTTVTGQTGELLRIVNSVNQAWIDLQLMQRDWRWMNKIGTMATVNGTRDYAITATSQAAFSLTGIVRTASTATATAAAAHGLVSGDRVTIAGAAQTDYNGTFTVTVTTTTAFTYTVANTPATPATGTLTATLVDYDEIRPYTAGSQPYILSYLTATGVSDSQPVYYIPYSEFAGYLDRGSNTSTGRPGYFTLQPDKDISFSPIPRAAYTITIPFRKTVQSLTADTSIPELPVKFHMLIAYRALMMYGLSNESNRAAAQAQALFKPMYRAMCNVQLPEWIC